MRAISSDICHHPSRPHHSVKNIMNKESRGVGYSGSSGSALVRADTARPRDIQYNNVERKTSKDHHQQHHNQFWRQCSCHFFMNSSSSCLHASILLDNHQDQGLRNHAQKLLLGEEDRCHNIDRNASSSTCIYTRPTTNIKDGVELMKAKIIAHPQYVNLMEAYIDCQTVGAPPELVARLMVVKQKFERRKGMSYSSCSKDPELDQFMEAYYDTLVKYKEDLIRPMEEAIQYVIRTQTHLNSLINGFSCVSSSDERSETRFRSYEEHQNTAGDAKLGEIDFSAEDKDVKIQLLKRYGGCLNTLKEEISKKKKAGKLPKEAHQKLLSWWESHCKWPYPTDSEKVALADITGLAKKQINNWFINKRKRHLKPPEDMQLEDGLTLAKKPDWLKGGSFAGL